jgi:regulator of nucleoside diphosphate kinase
MPAALVCHHSQKCVEGVDYVSWCWDKGAVSFKMLPKSAGAAKHSARNPIHITSHDKRLLEELLAETEALRPESRSDLKALAEELKRATVVEPDKVPHDVITMQSRAELVDLDTGETVTYTLVFPSRANIEAGNISVLAPVGAAMLGYRVNDEFEWQVPDGVRRMRVKQIHYQPEANAMSGR